jgi:hypothetical protein
MRLLAVPSTWRSRNSARVRFFGTRWLPLPAVLRSDRELLF